MTDDLIGKSFGPYQLQAFIRRGGMASIYRGYHAALERQVAVKVLPAELLRDPGFLSRFGIEARTLAKLQHPRILPIYDFGEAHGQPYIAMALMAGSLEDRLTPGEPMSPEAALPLLAAMAEALDYAHAHGILHRDVKPNNILFDSYGHPYLADFGIAKSLQASVGLTGTGIVGTLEYMSPEQARGEALDGRSDVYSLALVAYQLFTGQLAFQAETPAGYIFKHISEPPRSPRTANPSLPVEIEAVLLQGLAKDPGQRPPSAQALARALMDAHAAAVARTATAAHAEWSAPSRPPVAAPANQPVAAVRPPGAGRGRLAIGAGVGLALLVAIGGLWAITRPSPANPPSTSSSPSPVITAPAGGFQELFAVNTRNWPTGAYETERESGRRTLGEGVYRWEVQAKQGVFSWALGDTPALSDLRATVVITQTAGGEAARYGLLRHAVDQSRLDAFLINSRGEFAWVRFAEGRFINLIGWTATAALRAAGPNELALEVTGPRVALFVNGQLVGEHADTATGPDSLIGLVVDVDQGEALTVAFSALTVTAR